MGRVPREFYFSKEAKEDPQRFIDELEEALNILFRAMNRKPDMIINPDTAPASTDAYFVVGDFWLKKDTANLYICDSKDPTADPRTASWTTVL